MTTNDDYFRGSDAVEIPKLSARYRDNETECGINAAPLRNYRVSLVGYGVYAVWVTAESRPAARDLAEHMWSESRAVLPLQDGVIEYVEILDEYEAYGAE
jgi:hypothetical protein